MEEIEQAETAESKALTPVGEGQLSVSAVKTQTLKVKELMQSVMEEDLHYGKIQGCGNKQNLFKAGAEKIGFMFRLSPEFDIVKNELTGAHREYEVKCILTHIPSGNVMGEGVGLCSSMESKYRYRSTSTEEDTGKEVPKAYWDNRDQNLLGGAGFGPKKMDNGKWHIVKRSKGDKEENPDIADTYNTVLKMAKKRAFVDAVITATSASDFFTQDLEDIKANEKVNTETGEVVQYANKNQVARFNKLMDELANLLNWTEEDKELNLKKILADKSSLEQLTQRELEILIVSAEERVKKEKNKAKSK